MTDDFSLVDAIKKDNLEAALLRSSHSRLLSAAKMAFSMLDRKYEGTPPYEALLAAIAAAEELKL